MTITYDALGEIERLTNGRKMQRPKPVRDAQGRIARDPGAQWDWYYESVDPAERRYISSTYMADIGVSPDEIDLDAWLEMVRLARKRDHDPLADDYMAADAPEISVLTSGEIMGPQEVAELLCVQVNTVHQWRKRSYEYDDDDPRKMPEPFQIVSQVPLWTAEVIREWATDTGR